PMSNIDKRAIREAADAANKSSWGRWESYHPHKGARGYEVKVGVKAIAQHCLKVDSAFIAAANPATVLALLDELEAAERERDNWRTCFDNERFRADKLAVAFKTEHEQLVMANGALITQHMRANGAEKRIVELEAREVNGRFPLPKDSSQGWKIDPEFISKIQDAIGHDEECQCWEGSPSMEMVEVVLIAAAAIKMDERG
ncbi:ead/Ea22-like family protein, partial [Enterobacter hormaechei]